MQRLGVNGTRINQLQDGLYTGIDCHDLASTAKPRSGDVRQKPQD
jgi:hypothetical protein